MESFTTRVSLDPAVPKAFLTASYLLSTLRRLPGQLVLAPDGLGEDEIADLVVEAEKIDQVRGLAVGGQDADFNVHIGPHREASLHVIPVNSGAHLSSRDRRLGVNPAGANALGAMTAASLAAAEVFKHQAQVLPAVGPPLSEVSFCPVTLGSTPEATPPLPAAVELNLALVGLGAIGTATVAILAEMPFSGRAVLVDPERYAPENLGTYSLGGRVDAEQGRAKVQLAAARLKHFETECLQLRIEEAIGELEDSKWPWPGVALTGLDSGAARRAAQRIWTKRIFDGATGGTTAGVHSVQRGHGPCLICLFAPKRQGPSSAERLAAATGLPVYVAKEGDQPLKSQDLENLSPEERKRLEPYLGQPVCGLAEALGLTRLDAAGYRPAVPFVSQQAAALVIGRLVADILRIDRADNLCQFDLMKGPTYLAMQSLEAEATCFCQERRPLIEALVHQRALVRRHSPERDEAEEPSTSAKSS